MTQRNTSKERPLQPDYFAEKFDYTKLPFLAHLGKPNSAPTQEKNDNEKPR